MSKKMEEREELSVKWKNIKNEFPVITKGLFQPDLTAVIQSFDQTLQSWDKTEDSEKKLEDVLSGLATNLAKASGSMGSLRDTRDKTDKEEADLIKKTGETLNSFIGKKDLEMVDGQIFSALDAYANAMQTAFTTHNSLSDQISKHGAQMVAVAKKARDDYKSKSDAITAALKKSEADAIKFEAQIRQIGANYQKVAVQIENTKLLTAIRSFLAAL